MADQKIRALSLWQPWAELVASGHKRIETRHWKTDYRGPLVIHAAKTRNRETEEAMKDPRIAAALRLRSWNYLDFGAGICVVNLVACVPTNKLDHLREINFHFTANEVFYGNFSEGRFAWAMEFIQRLDPPVAARGYQALFDWPYPLEIRQAMPEAMKP